MLKQLLVEKQNKKTRNRKPNSSFGFYFIYNINLNNIMDKRPKALSSFVSRNLVAIVMVPTIIALHFGWNAMQNNRSLVQEHEQIDLPVVTFYKYCLKKLSGDGPATKAVKAENP